MRRGRASTATSGACRSWPAIEGLAVNTDYVEGPAELGGHVRSAVQGPDILHRQRLHDDHHAVSRPRRRLRQLHRQARRGAEGDQRSARLPDQAQGHGAQILRRRLGSAADVHQRGHLSRTFLVGPGRQADHRRPSDQAVGAEGGHVRLLSTRSTSSTMRRMPRTPTSSSTRSWHRRKSALR